MTHNDYLEGQVTKTLDDLFMEWTATQERLLDNKISHLETRRLTLEQGLYVIRER